ncbi:hypothetical protein Taro_005128 [Colocasia esculenta]|uniref:Uncharacterized protein n=1 Tax=Colocasia esculenta TaxID=4460 RepID=A0A843TM48_COLES|nr:hypothetical protein [Colocasia esculenta]
MGRSPCCEKAHTNKGAWTKEEDQRLIAYIKAHGEGSWRSLPRAAGLLRCGKSCRLRWINYLRPDLKRGNFTEEEDELIIKLHELLGNKWSLIAGRLPGRTDNEIKNYWNTHIKRKLLSRGLDPQTHLPLGAAQPPYLAPAAAPREAPMIPDRAPAPPLAVAANKPAADSGDEWNTSSGSTNEELNLDLSISLPSYPSSNHSSSSTDTSSTPRGPASAAAATSGTTATAIAAAAAPYQPFSQAAVCLCCRLGFQMGTEACSCQTISSSPYVLRYYIPSQEGGQHVLE